MAARMAMMTHTIISSIRVKPCSRAPLRPPPIPRLAGSRFFVLSCILSSLWAHQLAPGGHRKTVATTGRLHVALLAAVVTGVHVVPHENRVVGGRSITHTSIGNQRAVD